MNIYVGNLSYETTENDLHDAFGEFGAVSKVNVIMDKMTGKSKGFAFVEMGNDTEGQKAVDELNDADLNGRNLKVNLARPRTERPARNNW
ncbi:MAG: RNA-binding protein [Candidatus Neomarinimicrobiota bacterium]|nr:MAG: RNA-binding protein [Candidatus Neomarinimicrobiota bacterium]